MQRQHGKTSAQVNHVVVVVVSPVYVSGTGTLGNVQILSLAVLHSPNIKFNSAIQCLQLVLLKSKNDESPSVYVHKFTPIMVRNNFHLFVNKHVVCLTWVFTT